MSALVERDAELETFDQALRRPGSVILVSGEAGIGKTTLVRAFAARAGRRVAYAYCERVSSAVPLAPFHDLAELVGATPPIHSPPLAPCSSRCASRPL